MGGTGPRVYDCAAEIYREWAACQHFHLYDDVVPALRELAARGLRTGLISNSHRSLTSFLEHFDLHGLIEGAVSSSEHGYLKPHPSIFEAALRQLNVCAGEALMVGDSFAHDIEGAARVGMRGVLVLRSPDEPFARRTAEVPVIRDLSKVVDHL
jgi:putative hydrolase of the HAD superfamily